MDPGTPNTSAFSEMKSPVNADETEIVYSSHPQWMRSFGALNYRMWKQKLRSPCCSIMELLIPLAAAAILVALRNYNTNLPLIVS